MIPREYLLPYLVSNAVALSIVTMAFAWPRVTRWVWAAIFLWAAIINSLTATRDPVVYLVYGALTPSEWYRAFIEGWFSRHIAETVLAIAAGQAAIVFLLTRDGRARRLGVAGAATFLLAIAPLGIGSAFPFSLTAIASLLVMEYRLSSTKRLQPSPASAFVPAADFTDDRAIEIQAPAAVVFDTARQMQLSDSPLARAIARIRGLVTGAHDTSSSSTGLVGTALARGWGVLAYRAGRVLVMGVVCRPWERDLTFSAVEPSQFAAFGDPELVKIAWSLEVEPRGAERTIFRTETRVAATDFDTRRRFKRDWRLSSTAVWLIRWAMLRSLKREAERRWSSAHAAGRAA